MPSGRKNDGYSECIYNRVLHEETPRVFRWDFRIVLHRSCGAATPEAFPSCTARYSDTAYRVLSFPSPDASVIERTKKHPTRIQHKNKAPHRASPPPGHASKDSFVAQFCGIFAALAA